MPGAPEPATGAGTPPRDDVPGDALAGGLARAWRLLRAAVDDRHAPFRTPVVATVRGDGAADGRVMVLRAVDPAAATLTFFTDVRAAKAHEVAAPLAVVAYDPAVRLQLRLRGIARVATGGAVVEAAWAGVPAAARRAYRTCVAPGTPVPTAAAELAGDSGRANFAVLTVAVAELEWLGLAGDHRRAVHRAADGWRGTWLVP